MDLEIVAIGNELLLGFTVDTNGAELGRALAGIGVRVTRRTTVGDEPAAIRHAVQEALGRTGLVLTTGGLGPTRDDVSKKVIAELFGWPLRFHDDIWVRLVQRFRRMGRDPAPANRGQAEVPDGAVVLDNRWGTAPGLWFEGSPGLVIMLPGVPGEMRKLLEHEVMPRLAGRSGGAVVLSKELRTSSIPESTLATRIGDLEDALAPLSLAYLPGVRGVDLRLTAWNLPATEANAQLDRGEMLLRSAIGDVVYGEDGVDLAAVLVSRLRERGLTLGIGESCTGGLVGARVTAVPGSSAVFHGSAVCYSNQAKTTLLGVSADLIASAGAVSPGVALALARGARARFGTSAAIGLTGIAGPDGGTEEKPVGTVCFAWLLGHQEEEARYVFPGNREEVRERAAQFALHRLLRMAETD
jgi:nicotinamide-nucleotide amidase